MFSCFVLVCVRNNVLIQVVCQLSLGHARHSIPMSAKCLAIDISDLFSVIVCIRSQRQDFDYGNQNGAWERLEVKARHNRVVCLLSLIDRAQGWLDELKIRSVHCEKIFQTNDTRSFDNMINNTSMIIQLQLHSLCLIRFMNRFLRRRQQMIKPASLYINQHCPTNASETT